VAIDTASRLRSALGLTAGRLKQHLVGHIRGKGLGQHYAAISLLMVFKNRHQGPAHRNS
jgi:hypothetical protein